MYFYGYMKYVVEPIMSVKAAKELEGDFIEESHYNLKITDDAEVYWNDNGKERLLFHFKKGVVPNDMLDNAITVFKKEALHASSIRGTAGGAADPTKISPNVKDVVSKGKYRTKIVFKNGTVSNYYASNKVNSLIAGYFDKSKVADRHDDLQYNRAPCRTTMFTEKNNEQWKSSLPLIELMDQYYSELEPHTHKSQHHLASLTPQFQISDTAFSTLTVNYNWRTACHVDAGDYINGYSVIIVAEEGKWDGCYLGYPRFGVMVDVRQGDFLLKDPHQQHCNTPLVPLSKDHTRLSFVMYYRQNMQKCQSKSLPKTSQTGGAVDGLELFAADYPKRNIDLELYIRPETTDIKVIAEVLKQNVYEKPKLDFYIEEGERWLDLGGNIGTFALLALSHGASVVSCEPERDNLEILIKNLQHNFPDESGKGWQIVPKAVIIDDSETVDLYLCKGDYNKYRHTIYPKRGRQSVAVDSINVRELLTRDSFDGIKIDIEGAEIDILEGLEAKYYDGIQKVVYEYSFDIDPSIPRFLKIVEKLRKVFSTVHYTKVKENELEYKHFPAATMVYCIR
jgi:FkbM family methyltransferase